VTIGFAFHAFASFLAAVEYRIAQGEDPGRILSQLKPGDALLVQPGVYERQWTISGLCGKAESPIVIRSADPASQKPLFRPRDGRDGILFWGEPSEHVIIEGLRFEQAPRAGIVVYKSAFITIRNCEMISNGVWGIQTCLSDSITVESNELAWSQKEHGVYFSTTDHPVARGNSIHHNNRCGIHVNGDKAEGGDGMVTGGLVEGNHIFENGRDGGAGINMDGVEETTVRSNRLERNYAGGIVSFVTDGRESGSRNTFDGNKVLFRQGQGRYGLKVVGTPSGIEVTGNMIICGRGPAIELESSAVPGIRSDNNQLGVRHANGLIRIDDKALTLDEWRKMSSQDAHSSMLDLKIAL